MSALFFLCPVYRTLSLNEFDNIDGNCYDASLIIHRTRNFKKEKKVNASNGSVPKLIFLTLCLEIR